VRGIAMVDPRCVRTISALFLIATSFAATPAAAQDWPSRPVTMVIPFAAGSSIDVAGRILAPRLSELLGQQVIIENMSGSGGMTGAARVAKAVPDGYQFVLGGTATHAQNQTVFKTPLYDAAADFAPVVLVADTPSVLVTFKDLPVNNFQEFVAYAKTNQANMQFGSAGVSSASHLACALLNAAIGINVTHVPYRGGPAGAQDLIAGRIEYMCPLAAAALPQIEAKAVKALAILGKNRSTIFPAVPSVREQGLTDLDASSWYAVFLPKGAPAPIVQKLHDAVVAAMDTPSVQQRMKEVGAELVAPDRRSPDYLGKFIASEIERWGVAIKTANIDRE
jgi:tripartite-type tricarboxylate transporter receptor subunit TctC